MSHKTSFDDVGNRVETFIKTRYRVTWYVRSFILWNERLYDTFDTREAAEEYAAKLETWATTKQCKVF